MGNNKKKTVQKTSFLAVSKFELMTFEIFTLLFNKENKGSNFFSQFFTLFSILRLQSLLQFICTFLQKDF